MDEWLDPGVSGGQEDAVEMAEIQRAFGRLAPKEREILRRVGIDGESYAAVGMQMNLKAGTVKSRVFRAREHLRNLLNTPVAAGAMPRNAGRIRTGGSPMP
jgi:RNA polymerase sigma-70 factor (ECF subfamily)